MAIGIAAAMIGATGPVIASGTPGAPGAIRGAGTTGAAHAAGARVPSTGFPRGASPHDFFVRGNAYYERADYDSAIAQYDSLVAMGASGATLYYNMGNAYFKRGAIGRAVLNWDRANRITPRDGDVRKNLALATSLLKDRNFVRRRALPARVLRALPDRLNTRELASLAWGFYLVWTIIAIAFVFRRTQFVERAYAVLSIVSPGRLFGVRRTTDFVLALVTVGCIALGTGAVAITRYRAETAHRDAIVVVPETAVYSAPAAGAELQFKIHEGTRVRAERAAGGRIEIRLPGDLSGWVDPRAIERI